MKLIIIALLVIHASMRRSLLTLMLAIVLSALEVDRGGPVTRPSPIVIVPTDPPGPHLRSRPYRAHHRRVRPPVGYASVGS